MQSNKIIAYGRTAILLEYGDSQVLKLYREGFPSHDADHEYALSKLIYEAGVPCPKPYEVIEYNKRRGIIYERVYGDTMLKAISRQPWSLWKQSSRMAIAHAQTHRRTVPGLPDQKQLLKNRIQGAPLLTVEQKASIIAYLHTLPDGSQLCHGDYHPDNAMIGDRFLIIDWMNAMSGSAAGDVARSVLLLRYGTLPDEMPSLARKLFTYARRQMLERYEAAYRKETSMKREEIEAWLLPHAAARLVEGVPLEEKKVLLNFITKKLDEILSNT